MIAEQKWYHFFWYLDKYPRWSIGWNNDAIFFNTPLIGASFYFSRIFGKKWGIGFLPRIPLEQGQFLYKYNFER